MSYLDEVVHEFVNNVSSRLDIDLSWTLEERSAKLADASMQYRDELQGVLYRKNGGRNENPNRQGNVLEVRDVFLNNVDEAINNTEVRYTTTDHLYNQKQQGTRLSDSVAQMATYNDDATDVIAIKRGKVLKESHAQYKSVQNFGQLGEDRYLAKNAAIVVPIEDLQNATHYWQKRQQQGDPKADAVLSKLKAAKASKQSVTLEGSVLGSVVKTVSTEQTAKANQQKIADDLLLLESETAHASGRLVHGSVQQANTSLKQALSYMVGRCVIEIRKSWREGNQDISTRLVAVIDDTKAKFASLFQQGLWQNLGKTVLDHVLGMVSGFFSNIRHAIKKGGQYFAMICREVWHFITGQSPSLFHTLQLITKAIAGMAVVTLTIGLHQYLLSAGIPELLAGVLTAFVSALVSVAIFRLIDKTVRVVTAIFCTRDASRIRREEIEQICEDMLPAIEAKVALLDDLITQEDDERRDVFDKSFATIKASMNEVNIAKIATAYEGLYAYLGKNMPFRTLDEFDEFMLDDNTFIL